MPRKSSLPDIPNLPPGETGFRHPRRRFSSPSLLQRLKVGEERASVLRGLFRARRNSRFDETSISLSYRKAFKHCLSDRLFSTHARTRRRDSEKVFCAFFHCSLLCHRCQHCRARISLYLRVSSLQGIILRIGDGSFRIIRTFFSRVSSSITLTARVYLY